MVLIVAAALLACPLAAAAAGSLTAEVFANSVMRGTPVCTTTVANGFTATASSLCGPAHGASLVAGEYSIRTRKDPRPQISPLGSAHSSV